jgi:hypothetical protein
MWHYSIVREMLTYSATRHRERLKVLRRRYATENRYMGYLACDAKQGSLRLTPHASDRS